MFVFFLKVFQSITETKLFPVCRGDMEQREHCADSPHAASTAAAADETLPETRISCALDTRRNSSPVTGNVFALERETNRGASGVASFRFSDSSCDSRRACVRATLRCFSAVFGAKLAISAARRDKLFILCQVLRTHCPANPLSQPRSKVVLVWWVPCGAVCGVLSQTVGRGTSRDTAPACLLHCLLLLLLFLLLLSSRGSPIG